MDSKECYIQREKGEDLTQSYKNSPFTIEIQK